MEGKEEATCAANYLSFLCFLSLCSNKKALNENFGGQLCWCNKEALAYFHVFITLFRISDLLTWDCRKRFQDSVFGYCSVPPRNMANRASSQLLDKTLDASDKSHAQPWDYERAAVQPIMQNCAAKMRFLSLVNRCFCKMQCRIAQNILFNGRERIFTSNNCSHIKKEKYKSCLAKQYLWLCQRVQVKPAFLRSWPEGKQSKHKEAEESGLHQAGLEQFLNVLRIIKNKKNQTTHKQLCFNKLHT